MITYFLLQVRAARAGLENLSIPSQEAQRRAQEAAAASAMVKSPDRKGDGAIRWRVGELEWEAWMRVLDNAVSAEYGFLFIMRIEDVAFRASERAMCTASLF